MKKILSITIFLSTFLLSISNYSIITKNENHQVREDDFSINFEGAYSNITDSFDFELLSNVSDKSLVKIIIDEPKEIEQLNYVRPSDDDSLEVVQQSLSNYRKEVQNIIYSNNLRMVEKIDENLNLDIVWQASEIANLLTAEINSSEITSEFITELEQLQCSADNIDSIYISESIQNFSCDYSMNDVYDYTHLTDAINSTTYLGRGINFGIIDAGVLNLSKYRGNLVTNNDYTGRNIYIRNRNNSYADHSDHVAMLSVGNNGIARGTNIYSTTYNDSFESNMKWMIENGVNIVNTSYGSYSSTNNGAYTSDAKLADQFIRDYFISLVGSAGNLRSDSNPNNEISSPKTAYNYITVGNTSSSNNYVSSSSSYTEKNSYGGSKPNIVAPGYTKTNSYDGNYADGTSFSSPITAGALALLMEEFPYLSAFPELCISILTSSASPLSSYYNTVSGDNYFHSSGLHNKFGSGMLNYEKMREAANNYLSVSRKKGKTSGLLDKTLDFEVMAGKRIRASLAWLATGGE